MADLWNIIASNYKTVGLTVPSKTPYVAVDPKIYEGTWTGKYADNKTFKFTVSNVTGFRAKVQYQSGDTKFTLSALGKAEIKNVVTDPSSGQTYLDQAYATRSS